MGTLSGQWAVGDKSLGPKREGQVENMPASSLWTREGPWRWQQGCVKSLPSLSLPLNCASQERARQSHPGDHPTLPVSHPYSTPLLPSLFSHLLSLCGLREGVAILGSLCPTLSRGKSTGHQRQPQLAPNKLGHTDPGAGTPQVWPCLSLIQELVCPCSQRVPSGPHAALVAPLLLC